MIRYAEFDTPLGRIFAIAEDDKVTGIHFKGGRHAPQISKAWENAPKHPALRECARQLIDYFAGKRRSFDLASMSKGTEFQRRVWKEIARIPYGETITYAELARRAGAPGSARAAGAATGRNPLSIMVPCHRVVGSGGSLTGYAGGLDRKARLLALEKA